MTKPKTDIDKAREILRCPLKWSERFLHDPTNTKRKFKALWCQREVLMNDGREHRLNTVRAQRGCGKLLDVDTKIPTPYGWTTMGQLVIGDRIFDEHGKPCNVTFVSYIEEKHESYLITFDDGVQIVAGPEHQWFVHTRSSRRAAAAGPNPRILPKVVTTADMLNDIYVGPEHHKEVNYSIDITKPLECIEKTLPIGPYTLGAWLGDGTSRWAGIHSADPEIIEHIKADGYVVSDPVADKRGNKAMLYSIGEHQPDGIRLGARLSDRNLIKNKHIPAVYQRASVRQRTELLMGLMDTDGYVSPGGRCEYTTTNATLAHDVYLLVIGLGFKATQITGRATLNGKDCGEKYRILFTPHRPVFKLTRKLERQHSGKAQQERTHRRYIVSIEKTTPRDMCCISVDSPNNLYLAGEECVVTHNTESIVSWLLWYAFTHDHKDILILGPFELTIQRVFEKIQLQLDANPDLGACVTRNLKQPYQIELSNGTRFRGLTTNVSGNKKGQKIRGEHPHVFYIDEADYLTDEDYDAFMSLIDSPEAGAVPPVVWMTTTPTGRRSFFYFLCEDKGPGGKGTDWKDWWYPARHQKDITFSGEDYTIDKNGFQIPGQHCKIRCSGVNPGWDRVRDDRQRSMHGEQAYYHEILAWWGDSTYSVFPRELIEKAMQRSLPEKLLYQDERKSPAQFFTIGIDVDQRQTTPTMVVIEYRPDANRNDMTGGSFIVRLRETLPRPEGGLVLRALKQRVVHMNRIYDPIRIYMDNGYGDPIVQELQELGMTNLQGKWFRENVELHNPLTHLPEAKTLKHVMIAFARRMFEEGRVIIAAQSPTTMEYDKNLEAKVTNKPKWDNDFVKNLINYQVVSISKTGVPEYVSDNEHDVDAFLLALWAAIEQFDRPFSFDYQPVVAQMLTHEESNIFGGKNQPIAHDDTTPQPRDRSRQYQRCSPQQFVTQQRLKSPNGRSFSGSNPRRSF